MKPVPGISAPLTADHARQFEELVSTLAPEEVLWISGYMAGLVRQVHQPATSPAIAAPSASPAQTLTILYGSQTGHAAELAKRMEKLARDKGIPARSIDMADFRAQELKQIRHLAVLVSTYGEGQPPDGAASFYEFLHSRKAPRLESAKVAVLGLGDSTYVHFCQTGKDLESRLEALGAKRIYERADCDVDYKAQATEWIDSVLGVFLKEMPAAVASTEMRPAVTAGVPVPSPVSCDGEAYDSEHPFQARILDTIVLNGRGSDKETRHIELSLEGSGVAYAPGDSLGVAAENDPAQVEELIQRLEFKPDEPVPDGVGEVALVHALANHYEITTITSRFMEKYAEVAEASKLRTLIEPANRSDLFAYLKGRHVLDIVEEFPVKGLAARAFVGMLRKLQPRLYSLASSQAAYPDEAHLTVAVVRYESYAKTRKGVASGYMAERREIDDTVPVFLERNDKFRLPADGAAPIIMVGAGTGVAPFRAFLQEREAQGSTGRNWLFYGDRRFRLDFLYQIEWQRFLKQGTMSRMDVAFSRDQGEKVYVQHRLQERAKELFAWIEEGATVYVCGDANHMATDVHEALLTIVEREGAISREHAEEYVKRMQQERRYQRDVY